MPPPAQAPESWPDPAALLLTALGPGPRLWERGPGHPEALTVRLGTADRAAPDGSGLLPAVPVTADLREAGALGLAGPRERLAGLARAVVAQLAALHSPDALEIVLISADRSRPAPERTAEWSWLGWLPHVRPGHGQDCRLLLAYDREQAAARTDELLRRLEDHLTDRRPPGPQRGPAARSAASQETSRGAPPVALLGPDDARRTSGGFPGRTPWSSWTATPVAPELREAVARLAREGPRAGIHVVCLAETPGRLARVPGDGDLRSGLRGVARLPAVRCGRAAQRRRGDGPAADACASGGPGPATAGPVGHGTVAAVDAVSQAWAERFARALAPLRTDGAPVSGTRACPHRCPRRRGCSTSWGSPGPPPRR